MKDLTVIIPLHIYNDSVKTHLKDAIDSYSDADAKHESTLLFIGPKEVLSSVKADFSEKWMAFTENEESDFATQINKAAGEIKTKYFSILEFDDVYSPKWFKNVEENINMGKEISLYLPLTEIVDNNKLDEGPIGYINEVVWASSFSDELGYLDMESLQSYMNFNTTGGVFKTEDFISAGGLKPSIKLSFWYEFMLRLIHNGKKIYTIPKVGYQHFINREGSLMDEYNKTMKAEEADWWIDLAKKEFYFVKDRKKVYNQ